MLIMFNSTYRSNSIFLEFYHYARHDLIDESCIMSHARSKRSSENGSLETKLNGHLNKIIVDFYQCARGMTCAA